MNQVNYLFNLSRALYQANPGLLLRHKSEIVESRGLWSVLKNPILERIEMLSWDGDTCWKVLEEFCEAGKDKQFVNEVDLGFASRIIEALARDGEKYIDRVHDLLALEVVEFKNNPMSWMEPLMVELAREMRLESAIHLIIEKLKIEFDKWKAEAETKRAGQDERYKQLFGNFYEEETLAEVDDNDSASLHEANQTDGQKTRTFLRDTQKFGRNEPCPCGSGKKYKKCCLAKEHGI